MIGQTAGYKDLIYGARLECKNITAYFIASSWNIAHALDYIGIDLYFEMLYCGILVERIKRRTKTSCV